jgi:hypothetical protein
VRKSRYSDEQIAAALRQAEAGTPIAELTRKLGISEASMRGASALGISAHRKFASYASCAKRTRGSSDLSPT